MYHFSDFMKGTVRIELIKSTITIEPDFHVRAFVILKEYSMSDIKIIIRKLIVVRLKLIEIFFTCQLSYAMLLFHYRR